MQYTRYGISIVCINYPAPAIEVILHIRTYIKEMTKILTREEIQCRELKLLAYFDGFMRKHNLTYFMSGGTLLGAVRHKGFIPWDDDADLMMPRDDYEKLLSLFKDEDEYRLSSIETDPEYQYPYARLWDPATEIEWSNYDTEKIGVFVDIFPIDGFPDSRLLSDIHVINIRLLTELWHTVMKAGPGNDLHFKKLRKMVRPFLKDDPQVYLRRINKAGKRYSWKNSRFAGVSTLTHYMFKERNPKNIYEETVYLPFEHLSLPAPSGYSTYLTNLYGDYMTPPPESARKTDHTFAVKEREGWIHRPSVKEKDEI